jgi:hypothetical protein
MQFKAWCKKFVYFTSIPLSVLAIIGCGEQNMTTFDWIASESGPKHYPMKIVSGNFELEKGGSTYIPSGVYLNRRRWGQYRSTHLSGPDGKSLPTKLNITYFSYLEDKFYQGSFDLPYEEILTLFQTPYYSTKAGGETRYDSIITGVSPGGGVAVWLDGLDKTTQVFYGKAQIISYDWKSVTASRKSREHYVKGLVEGTLGAEGYAKFLKNGIDLSKWDNFQKRYHWQLELITENRVPKIVPEIHFVNGETDQMFYPESDELKNSQRAIPNFLYYLWKTPEGKPLMLEWHFDVNEITSAFEKIEAVKPSSIESPILLTIQTFETDEGRRYALAVQRVEDNMVIYLKKTTLESYLATDRKDGINFYLDDD